MNRYIITDIHGMFLEFIELLKKANFNYDEDELIVGGDIVDRGPEPMLCILELLKIKNVISVQGNHDIWFYNFIVQGSKNHFLEGKHGSKPTIEKWLRLSDDDKKLVFSFLKAQRPYYVDQKNNLFVHAGFDKEYKIEEQLLWDLVCDMHFIKSIMSSQKNKIKKIATIENFNEIFVGHTATIRYIKDKNGIYKEGKGWDNIVLEPIHIHNVWMMDTGSGFKIGRLSLMNIDTKELFQVDAKNDENEID